MKKILLIICIIPLFINGQNKKKLDHKAIKSMCGCYEVTFNFTETFSYSTDSLYKASETKSEKAMEWVQLVEEDDNKISMQHLLQVGNPNKPYIVKHWRQDWIYENTDFYMFNTNNNWTYIKHNPDEVRGQWTQKVFQVDDSPRYEGTATWVHVDGKSYWENITPAPLPRREYTKRADYNLTLRGNRHEITDNGWIHDQDNKKIIRIDGKTDQILAEEKGFNTYVKLPDSKCKGAQDWWLEHEKKWKLVRQKWSEVYGRKQDLTLHKKVDNKLLYKYLFNDEDYSSKKKINTIIDAFVTETPEQKSYK